MEGVERGERIARRKTRRLKLTFRASRFFEENTRNPSVVYQESGSKNSRFEEKKNKWKNMQGLEVEGLRAGKGLRGGSRKPNPNMVDGLTWLMV